MNDELPEGVTPEEVNALKLRAKEELRKRVAALRRALKADARAMHARAMSERALTLPELTSARVICAYAPLRFEIDCTPLVEHAWARGCTVALPRVDTATNELVLHRYQSGDALEESGFGVREPVHTADVIEPTSVDLVLVPGLAFDARGYRLGYGKGYYDRLLPRTGAFRLALAFDFQLLVEVPTFPHDVPVDCVVTDRRVLRSDR